MPDYERRLLLLQEALDAAERSILVANPHRIRHFTGYLGPGFLCISPERRAIFTYSVEYQRARDECRVTDVFLATERPVPRGVQSFFTGSRAASQVLVEEELPWSVARELPVAGSASAILAEILGRKDEARLRDFRAAGELAFRVLDDFGRFARAGRTERELAAFLNARLFEHGAERLAFDTIVASGPNSAYCHGVPGDRRLEAGDLVIVDLGPVVGEGEADITRTYHVGPAGERARRVYAAVIEAQTEALSRIHAGAVGGDVDASAREVLGRFGLADHFCHSLGHSLGGGPHLMRGGTDVLRTGNVVTVEPGVYLPGWGGVRVEDNVLVSEDGARLLAGDRDLRLPEITVVS